MLTPSEFATLREDLRAMSARVDALAAKVEALAVSVAGCQPLCTFERKRRSENWKLVAGAVLAVGVGWITKHFGG